MFSFIAFLLLEPWIKGGNRNRKTGGQRRQSPATSQLSLAYQNHLVFGFWAHNLRETDGSRQVRAFGRGGFGACSLVLGFFWVFLGCLGFGILRSLHTRGARPRPI